MGVSCGALNTTTFRILISRGWHFVHLRRHSYIVSKNHKLTDEHTKSSLFHVDVPIKDLGNILLVISAICVPSAKQNPNPRPLLSSPIFAPAILTLFAPNGSVTRFANQLKNRKLTHANPCYLIQSVAFALRPRMQNIENAQIVGGAIKLARVLQNFT